MASLQSESGIPLYRQLKQVLGDRIAKGDWKPGDLIPSEKELETEFGVSRTTVRQALRDLDYDGLISRHRGRGTFVSEPKVQHGPGRDSGLADGVDRAGKTAAWQVLAAGLSTVSEDAAEALAVKAGTQLFRTVRLRLVDDVVLGVLVAYVAPGTPLAADLAALSHGQSLSYLGGAALGHADRVIDAKGAGTEVAGYLTVPPGSPVLRIRRTTFAADGSPIEYMVAHYRGDRFEYTLSGSPLDPL